MRLLSLLGVISLLGNAARAIKVNLDDPQSVKDAASTIAFGLMSYYTGNNTGDVPGNLPDPYFCTSIVLLSLLMHFGLTI